MTSLLSRLHRAKEKSSEDGNFILHIKNNVIDIGKNNNNNNNNKLKRKTDSTNPKSQPIKAKSTNKDLSPKQDKSKQQQQQQQQQQQEQQQEEEEEEEEQQQQQQQQQEQQQQQRRRQQQQQRQRQEEEEQQKQKEQQQQQQQQQQRMQLVKIITDDSDDILSFSQNEPLHEPLLAHYQEMQSFIDAFEKNTMLIKEYWKNLFAYFKICGDKYCYIEAMKVLSQKVTKDIVNKSEKFKYSPTFRKVNRWFTRCLIILIENKDCVEYLKHASPENFELLEQQIQMRKENKSLRGRKFEIFQNIKPILTITSPPPPPPPPRPALLIEHGEEEVFINSSTNSSQEKKQIHLLSHLSENELFKNRINEQYNIKRKSLRTK